MAFPTTSVLDSFTRADESPLANSTWLGPMQTALNQLKLTSNVARLISGVTGQSYWSAATSSANCEVFCTVPTLPGGGSGVAIWVRLANPGNAGTATAYLLSYTAGTGFKYFKFTTGNTFTQLGSTDSTTISAGDSIGLSASGGATTTLAGFKKTAGTWAALPITPTVTDASSPITAAGFIGMEGTDLVVTMDDFGGGSTVVSGGLTPSASMLLLGV